jgi:hypothetical protein
MSAFRMSSGPTVDIGQTPIHVVRATKQHSFRMMNRDTISIDRDGKHYCQLHVPVPGKAYYEREICNRELFKCDWCSGHACPRPDCIPEYRAKGLIGPSKKHEICLELECTRITCCPSGICAECEKRHYFDWVTEAGDVAIGSYQAPYETFDMIVNLDYPYNEIQRGAIVYSIENQKHVIRCGFVDDKKELTHERIDRILDMITSVPFQKVLFHCYAGVSRSSTLAIAFLARRDRMTTSEVFERVKMHRPRIDPNEHFRMLLGLPAQPQPRP